MKLTRRVLELANTTKHNKTNNLPSSIQSYWPTVSTKKNSNVDKHYHVGNNYGNDRFWPTTLTRSQLEHTTQKFYKKVI